MFTTIESAFTIGNVTVTNRSTELWEGSGMRVTLTHEHHRNVEMPVRASDTMIADRDFYTISTGDVEGAGEITLEAADLEALAELLRQAGF